MNEKRIFAMPHRLVGAHRLIVVEVSEQRLTLIESGDVIGAWPVSTAANGVGERSGSGCTPTGWHTIRARIGAGLAPGTVFIGRRPTGEIYSDSLALAQPDRDWILSRILWLSGAEPGHNRLGGVDTMRRYIYIHGTPDCEPMGVPRSHGCIRMRNSDVIELFDQTTVGTPLLIT